MTEKTTDAVERTAEPAPTSALYKAAQAMYGITFAGYYTNADRVLGDAHVGLAQASLDAGLDHGDVSRAVEDHTHCRPKYVQGSDGKVETTGMDCGLPFPDAPEGSTFRSAHIADGIRWALLGTKAGS